MTTQTITIDTLINDYAPLIASSVDLDPSEYGQTADGLARLLCDAADHISPLDQTREWLEAAAADLNAISRLGGDNDQTRELLKRIDNTLYEVKSELETY